MTAVCGLLVWIEPGRADSAPRSGVKHVPVTLRLELAEPFADYIFLESHIQWPHEPDHHRGTPFPWSRDTHDNPTFTALAEIGLTVERPREFVLGPDIQQHVYAVPRAEYEKNSSPNDLFDALNADKVKGAAQKLLSSTEEVGEQDPRSRVVIRYRIERSKDGVIFTKIGQEDAGGFRMQGASLYVLVGSLLALSLVGFGIIAVTRRRRPPPK
jgi:hypothetical protein